MACSSPSSSIFGFIIFLLVVVVVVCGENPVAAADALIRPRKYGPLGELGYDMVAAAEDDNTCVIEQLLRRTERHSRLLLEAGMNEIDVVERKADLNNREKNVQEPELQQMDHHDVAASKFSTDQQLEKTGGGSVAAVDDDSGEVQQELLRETAILEEEVKLEMEEAGIGPKTSNLTGMHSKTEGPELKTEEKELSKSEFQEEEEEVLKKEELEFAHPVKKKVVNETTAEEFKELSKPEADEVMNDEEKSIFPVKKRAGSESSELKAAEKALSKSEEEEAEERSDQESKKEQSKSVKDMEKITNMKAKEEKALSTADDAHQAGEVVDPQAKSIPGKKNVGSQAELKAAEEKAFSKSEAQEAVEQQEEKTESIPVKKKVGNETELKAEAAADEKELAQVPGSQEVEEKEIVPAENRKVSVSAENENSMSAEKDGTKQTNGNTTTSREKDGMKLTNGNTTTSVELKPENQEQVEEQKQEGSRTVEKPKEVMKIEGTSDSGEGNDQEELSKDLPDSKGQQEGGQVPDKEKSARESRSVEQAAGSEQKEDVKVNRQNDAAKSDNVEKKEGSDDSEAKSQENLMSKAGSEQKEDVRVNGQKESTKSNNMENTKEGIDDGADKSQEKTSKGASLAAAEEADPAIDLDPHDVNLLQEVQDLPANFQQTVGAVASHVIPQIQQISDQSINSFDKINKNLASRFLPWIGEKYAPIIATLISYCLLLPPLALVVFLCDRIRAILTLQKVLLFINIYLVAYFAILLIVALGLGSEPIAFLDQYSPSSYIVLQLLQAFGYMIYMLLQTADVIITCSTGSPFGKSSATIQWLLASMVGLHYYVTVFHRAMAREHPQISWKFYGFYSLSFLVCCLLARTHRSKKEYIPLGDETTDKKN